MIYYNLKKLLPAFILVFGLASCGEEQKRENTKQVEDSSSKSVSVPENLFENEYAKVVQVKLETGQFLDSHHGENRLIYSLSDYSIDWEEEGNKKGTKSWKAGQWHYHDAGEHAAQNGGEQTAQWLAFVRKKQSLPACADTAMAQHLELDSPFAKTVFENEVFKAIEIELPTSESLPMHLGFNRLIYSQSTYTLQYQDSSSQPTENTFNEGEVHWHDACVHKVENTGQETAHFIVVIFKETDHQ